MIQKNNMPFINDFYQKDMLNIDIFRSPIDKGEIIDYRLPATENTIYTVSCLNIPGKNDISFLENHIPVLADKYINYKGEPIFLLAADNEKDLISYKKTIEIEYKLKSSMGFSNFSEDDQVVSELRYNFPESVDSITETSLSEKPVLIEDHFSADEYHSRYSETNGAVVVPEKNGVFTVYTVTQWPYHVKKSVAETIGISINKVNVIITELSSPLEGRIWFPSLISSQAALIAYITGKPSKLFLTENDNFRYTPRQFPFRIDFKTEIFNKIKKISINLYVDCGAFPVIDNNVFKKTITSAASFYGFDNISINIKMIKTSKPPMSFISSFNFTPILSAFEMHVTHIAKKLSSDPYRWRIDNLFTKSKKKIPLQMDLKSLQSSKISSANVLHEVVKMSDFSRKYAAYEYNRTGNKSFSPFIKKRGIGISVGFFNNDLPVDSMENEKISLKLLLDSKGILNIYTSTVPDGKYNYTIWKNIASEILGLNTDDILIAVHETDNTPESSPYIFSKELAGFSELLKKSCQSLQRKRFRSPLPIEIKRTITLDKLKKGDIAWGASVVELEFDQTTLETEIKGVWNCIDCGKIVAEEIIEKKIYSGIIDSLSWISTNGKKSFYTDNSWKFYNTSISTSYINSNTLSRSLSIGDIPLALIPGAYYYAFKQAIGKDIKNISFNETSFYNIINRNDT